MTPASLRTAFCAAGELFGGVERLLLGLGAALAADGPPPPLILFHDAELAAQARAQGWRPTILPARHRYDPALGRELAEILEREGVAVVHAHGYKAVLACLLARRHHRFAVVKTEHGRREPRPGDPLRGLRMRLNLGLDAWATRRLDAVVAYVTEDVRAHFAGAHRGLVRRTVVNGIAPLEPADAARPAELFREGFQVGIVGRVAPVKGIATALAALALPEAPRDLILHVVGDGPERPSLEREAARLGLADRVLFHGFRRDARDWLAHLDALLMPSRHEGLPLALLEAMALGTPVVASRVGGLAEVLRDGETGLLVPPGDPAALLAAWRRLAADPALARRIGDAARDEQRRRYSIDRVVADYADLYAEAAARG